MEKKYVYGIIGLSSIAFLILVFLLVGDARWIIKNSVPTSSFGNSIAYNVPQRSSANESVTIATNIYEIPFDVMTNSEVANILNKSYAVTVFVYREGMNYSINNPTSSYEGYRFERWNSSINNMFTDNGILFSAASQGFDENNHSTRFFIKPKSPLTEFQNSTYKTQFCNFLSTSLNGLQITRTRLIVHGYQGVQNSVASRASDRRANGDYYTNDDWEFTEFGPDNTNFTLCPPP